jgi:hypothetical protein
MDANIQALKNYIASQRAVNVDDQTIYQSLVASGWQHDAIVSAMSQQVEVVDTPAASPAQQAIDTKAVKKVKVIGVITIVLGALAIVGGLYTGINGLQLLFGAIEIVIGFGLLKYSRVAFTFFNVLAILAILSSLLLIPSVIFGLLVLSSLQSIELIIALFISAVLSLGQLVFYIIGGIVLHTKSIQLLFKKI